MIRRLLNVLMEPLLRVRLFVAWYDFWIGVYWDRKRRWLYLCPLPMIGLIINCGPWGWEHMDYDEWQPGGPR